MHSIRVLSKSSFLRFAPFVFYLAISVFSAGLFAQDEPQFSFHHENILGTNLEVQVQCDDQESADRCDEAILAELNRLDSILSQYNSNSEISRWLNTVEEPTPVSEELFELLRQARHFRELTSGAFHPGAGALAGQWKAAVESGVAPTAESLAREVERIAVPLWHLDAETKHATRLSDVPVSLNAIAKGYIIDVVLENVMSSTDAPSGLMINVGGDIRVAGEHSTAIGIRHPIDIERLLGSVNLKDNAIATSGNYHRGFDVGDKHYSHIIDPRTGQPCDSVPGVSVIAPTAATADALSTAFSVLGVEESLAIAGSVDGVECQITLENGEQKQSPGWATVFSAAPAQEAVVGKELIVNLSLVRGGGRRYRRPYVAIWIEDDSGFPVRTMELWLMEERPGPRWHRDLTRWYQGEAIRDLNGAPALIGSISEATRPPGRYKTVWDGKDDTGKVCEPGPYTLFLEAAREHGTYQLMQHEFNVGGDDFDGEFEENAEFESATYEYRDAEK